MKQEILHWMYFALKLIPGRIGCLIRNNIMPYKCGKNVTIWDFVHIATPSKLKIGDNVSINRGTVIQASGGINIGNDVLIGPNCTIYSQNHNYKKYGKLIRNQGYTYKTTTICNNVWIASNVIILPGIKIGSNSVVGAGAIVTKDVPENSLAYGIPLIIKEIDFEN